MVIDSKDVPKPVLARVAVEKFPALKLKNRFSSFAGVAVVQGAALMYADGLILLVALAAVFAGGFGLGLVQGGRFTKKDD